MERHPDLGGLGRPVDIVDYLREVNRNNPGLLPETHFRANVLFAYLTGMDTSANVCGFMLHAVLSRPKLLERIRVEVDEVLRQGPPTMESLLRLDVTRRVVLETLRMYPVVPALPRVVSNSFEFGGYRVPAGTEVLLGNTVSHYLRELFPDPEGFDIERYADGEQQHLRPGAYAPFGLGRHRCLGSGFAEMQAVLTVANIVHRTELEFERPGRPLKVKSAPHLDESVRFRVVGRRVC